MTPKESKEFIKTLKMMQEFMAYYVKHNMTQGEIEDTEHFMDPLNKEAIHIEDVEQQFLENTLPSYFKED